MVTVHHFHSVGECHNHPAVTTTPQYWSELTRLPIPHVVEQTSFVVLQVARMQDELLCGIIDIRGLVFQCAEPGQDRTSHVQRVNPVLVTARPVVDAAFGTALC